MAAVLPSLRALLNSIIDYAGLFPPAKLDMATTVRNYTKYLNAPESWMLGRLIVPAARLNEFEEHVAALLPRSSQPETEPWQISALTVAADNLEQLAADIAAIEAFNLRHEDGQGGLAVIDVLELKAENPDAIESALDQIPGEFFPFFEMPIERDPRGLIAALVEGDAGAKVRTGGTSAEAYPTPQDLARFIAACAAANVPFKATAGLHHPLCHSSEAINADEFGFLNVFIAGCLAYTHELETSVIQQALEDASLATFTFDDDGLSWREHRLKIGEIDNARESLAVSFGSCSFDEPVEELRRLKLL